MANIAIVGATGLVGRTMLRVLQERNVPVTSLRLLASARSAGEVIAWNGNEYTVEELTEHSFDTIDYALFSAGGSISKQYAPIAAKNGCIVIDNSSAWRMDPDVPLVVPEVNPQSAHEHKGIIANPNCSTIQLVVALKPLHMHFGLTRVIVSTYQTPSGAGQKGIDHLSDVINGRNSTRTKFL
jgi:aspartate-semialdehyde dehydrogenase